MELQVPVILALAMAALSLGLNVACLVQLFHLTEQIQGLRPRQGRGNTPLTGRGKLLPWPYHKPR